MADTISIRPATPEDVPAILDTLRAALGETPLLRRTPELWRWKHLDNPFGPSLVLVAVAGERIAGVRAMLRWELNTPGGHLVRCLRPVDTATHPAFARQGIFRRLTLTALDLAREDGVHLVFNTPNPRSAAGYLSMGWREVGWVGVMVRPRLGSSVAQADAVPPLAEAIPGARPLHPVEHQREPLGLRTPRSSAYQRWRFGGHPTARYGAVEAGGGVAIVRPNLRDRRTELVLSDLLSTAAPRAVRLAGRRNRTRYLAGWFSPGSPERRAAVAGGMLPVPGLRTLRLVALPLADLDVDPFNLRTWDLATSDLELL